jgi:hypothetical protein
MNMDTRQLPARAGSSMPAARAATSAAATPDAWHVPKLATMPGKSAIGGPRAQNRGRLEGATVGRTNHSAALDGGQFRRRF